MPHKVFCILLTFPTVYLSKFALQHWKRAGSPKQTLCVEGAVPRPLAPAFSPPVWCRCYCAADHVAIPDFSAGAMENWGLVLYRESSLLHDDLVSPMANKLYVSLVISHEIAHTVSRYANQPHLSSLQSPSKPRASISHRHSTQYPFGSWRRQPSSVWMSREVRVGPGHRHWPCGLYHLWTKRPKALEGRKISNPPIPIRSYHSNDTLYLLFIHTVHIVTTSSYQHLKPVLCTFVYIVCYQW